MTAVGPRLALAVAKYLCRYRSAGLLRMALDLLRDPELREVWRRLGVEPAQAQAGGLMLFKAARIVREHVEYLQQRGAAEFVETAVYVYPGLKEAARLPGIQVANWKGKPCQQTP